MVTNLPLKCGGATSAMYTGTVIDATPTRINSITVIKSKEILHPFFTIKYYTISMEQAGRIRFPGSER